MMACYRFQKGIRSSCPFSDYESRDCAGYLMCKYSDVLCFDGKQNPIFACFAPFIRMALTSDLGALVKGATPGSKNACFG